MTMCTSGSIGIISCPQGAGSSLAFEVCGSVASPPYSLSGLSTAASISLSSGMTGFYGYSASANPIYFSTTDCSVTPTESYWCSCICGVQTGDSARVCLCWYTSTENVKSSAARACGLCNTTCMGGGFSGALGEYNEGEFYIDIDGNDSVCVITCAIKGISGISNAQICISNVVNIVGNYCIGSPYVQYSDAPPVM